MCLNHPFFLVKTRGAKKHYRTRGKWKEIMCFKPGLKPDKEEPWAHALNTPSCLTCVHERISVVPRFAPVPHLQLFPPKSPLALSLIAVEHVGCSDTCIYTEQTEAEGLGRKLLLTPPPRQPPENPWKADCGCYDSISQNAHPASTLSSLNAGTAERGCLGRGMVFGWPPAVRPPNGRVHLHIMECTRARVSQTSGSFGKCNSTPSYSKLLPFNSKTYQDGNGNGNSGKSIQMTFKMVIGNQWKWRGDCGRQDGNGNSWNSSEFQDGNGNGNFGEMNSQE